MYLGQVDSLFLINGLRKRKFEGMELKTLFYIIKFGIYHSVDLLNVFVEEGCYNKRKVKFYLPFNGSLVQVKVTRELPVSLFQQRCSHF